MRKCQQITFLIVLFFSNFIQARDHDLRSLDSLVQHLAEIANQHDGAPLEPIPIVGIGGCPGVGKTYFTRELAGLLREKGIRPLILPLHHFNLSPTERKEIGTEWDVRHFKMADLHHVLSIIHRGEKWIKKPTCDQLTGEIGEEILSLDDVDLILFEGLYALCSESPVDYFKYCELGIFLEARASDIFVWKWEREQKKVHPRTPEQFLKHINALFEEYRKNIEYSKKNASFLIEKDKTHRYHLEIRALSGDKHDSSQSCICQ